MKKLLLLTLSILVIICANAQVKITGTAKNHKAKRLKGVSITLKNSYDGTVTDSLGNLVLPLMKKESW